MTVTTIFADAADGDISSVSAIYSTARSGGVLTTPVGSANELVVGQLLFGTYACYESFISFDTSSIPDDDVISDVDLDLWLVTDASTTDFTVRARERDWGASLTTADWVPGASLAGVGNILGDLNSSGIGATGAYKPFTINASYLTNWKNAANMKTGTVHLVLYSLRHSNSNVPTGDERLVFSTVALEDPKLTITHAAATHAPPAFQRTTPRVWPMRGRT